MLRIVRSWLNFKVIFWGIVFAVLIFTVFVGLIWSSRAKDITQVPATAMLRVIEAPTDTPLAPNNTPTPETTSISSQEAPPPAGNIAVGDYVQVSGTGGDGLRLHETAGVSSTVKYIALEAELFTVKDGPVEADGYTWWLLQDPYTENAAGWGAANYLVVVQNP